MKNFLLKMRRRKRILHGMEEAVATYVYFYRIAERR